MMAWHKDTTAMVIIMATLINTAMIRNRPSTVNLIIAGTPVLLSSGDPDVHVPWERVQESAHLLRLMGAEVDIRRYPGRPHTIVAEELPELSQLGTSDPVKCFGIS
jgi:predicted esterase